jgi:ATP/maltotriose-dependent transcriptional regulator MalT
MLATLYRRTGRYDEAAKQLDRMDRLDEARKWRWEIAQERATLKRLAASKTDIAKTGTDTSTDATTEKLDNRVSPA